MRGLETTPDLSQNKPPSPIIELNLGKRLIHRGEPVEVDNDNGETWVLWGMSPDRKHALIKNQKGDIQEVRTADLLSWQREKTHKQTPDKAVH